MALGVASVLRLRAAYPQLLPTFGQVCRAPFTIAPQNAWVAASQLCNVALNSSDLLFIGRLLGLSEVTRYACTGRVLSVASAVPGAAAQASGPFIASLAVEKRAGKAAAALALSVVCIASWIAAGVVVANKAFVTIWVGGHLFGGPALTLALAACFLLTQLGGALVQIAFNLGDVRVPQIAMMVSSLLFLVTCPFFIRTWGPVGAALAMLMSISITSVPLLLWAAWRASSKFGGFSYLLVDWAIRTLALLLISVGLGRMVGANVLAAVAAVVGVTGLATALFGGYLYREPLRSYILSRLLRRSDRTARVMRPVLRTLEPWALFMHPLRREDVQ
jgi:O-antigen/teichoic acid export membrane protein